ncbi:Phosphatidylserine decarboxylase family protein [Ceratobasidium theobromae]|uniref:Phosphatidylserine decarboxylase family protein n=1 Tax=Ceratobasidium theobromae TaxID=1582974 RepID=A0A5N5QGK1_9AGAM|nr:Phosphatidylserine decarboxylase family protein [Ceratobasidium theobromae]
MAMSTPTPTSIHTGYTRVKQPLVHHRVGGWLPSNHRVLEKWIDRLLEKVEDQHRAKKALHPVIQEFQALIETDAVLFQGFHEMFEQVPRKPPYNQDPTLKPQIRDYKTMLRAFNYIITHAPEFEDNDLVGFPINAILDWPMGTDGGLKTFLFPVLNAQFKKMFDVWAQFLSSPDSRAVLTTEPNGWFGPAASAAIPNFAETFICDPEAPYYGFQSWDDFFTRSFRPGVRPIQFPDEDKFVNSACESTVYKIAYNIKQTDAFWLKGEPYSLQHMLNNDKDTEQFVGGTIYQAFLSALNFHRWVSPVNGTIVKTVLIPGTYYAESPAMGFDNPEGPDPAGPNFSQSFITSLAARALIFIHADNPKIGLMTFIAVGMSEVSTCETTVQVGQRVRKGDELGMFHFGGSTHCLVFRPETKVVVDPRFTDPGSEVKLNVAIATIE